MCARSSVELTRLLSALGFAARVGGVVWVLYLAIEPYARRFWPDGLLGWTRLAVGPLARLQRVGRDILIGLSFAALGLVLELARLLPPALGRQRTVAAVWRRVLAADGAAAVAGPVARMAFTCRWKARSAAAMVFVVARAAVEAIVAGADRGNRRRCPGPQDNGRALSGSWTGYRDSRRSWSPCCPSPSTGTACWRSSSRCLSATSSKCAAHLEPIAVVGDAVESHADPVHRRWPASATTPREPASRCCGRR